MRDRMALLPPGSLVVVRALPPAGDATHAQLARDLDAALQRLLGEHAMKYPLLALIKLYQWTISPLLGPVCKYYPSCSHYGFTGHRPARCDQGDSPHRLADPSVQSVVARRCRSCSAAKASAVARNAAQRLARTQGRAFRRRRACPRLPESLAAETSPMLKEPD